MKGNHDKIQGENSAEKYWKYRRYLLRLLEINKHSSSSWNSATSCSFFRPSRADLLDSMLMERKRVRCRRRGEDPQEVVHPGDSLHKAEHPQEDSRQNSTQPEEYPHIK
jgi:hypothetical protein